jgi:excinuclease UvrABC nuclease subunit
VRKRPSLDRATRRYYVYFLSDAAGAVIYVGRSQNVAKRLIGHYSDASNPDTVEAPRKALWLMDVRTVSMIGPFAWDQAVAEERRHIEQLQPFGNISATKRDPKTRCNGRTRVLRSAA